MTYTEGILIITNLVFASLYIKYLGKYHDRDMLSIMLKNHIMRLKIRINKLEKQLTEKAECQ